MDATPLSPPPPLTAAEGADRLADVLAQAPCTHGSDQSRWRLRDLRALVPELGVTSCSGVWRVLARLGFSRQRSRDHLRSPDPAYATKTAAIATLLASAAVQTGREVLLYEDEITIYRQPRCGAAYAHRNGRQQPRAERSHQSNTTLRVGAVVNARTGQVTAIRRSRLTVASLRALYAGVAATYPQAEQIWIVLDNWPVHYHADVLVALAAQQLITAPKRPPSWSAEPDPKLALQWPTERKLPIQLVPLPTYASWLNPVEKLWRKLNQEVLTLHRRANDLAGLGQAIDTFMAQFATGSPALLREIGLAPKTIN